MTQKNECCSKCKIAGKTKGERGCENYDCPCHTQSKSVEGWEERFDSMFDLDNYGDSHIVQNKVKSFITAELAKARESGYNEGYVAARKEILDKMERNLY